MNHRLYISNHRQGSVNPLDPTTKKGTDETPRNSKNQWRITHGKSPLPWIFDGFWLFVHGKHRSTMVYFPSQALQGHMMIVIFATDVTAEPEDRQGTICRLWDEDILVDQQTREMMCERDTTSKKKEQHRYLWYVLCNPTSLSNKWCNLVVAQIGGWMLAANDHYVMERSQAERGSRGFTDCSKSERASNVWIHIPSGKQTSLWKITIFHR